MFTNHRIRNKTKPFGKGSRIFEFIYANQGTALYVQNVVPREYVILIPRGKRKLKFCELICLHALLLKERSERI